MVLGILLGLLISFETVVLLLVLLFQLFHGEIILVYKLLLVFHVSQLSDESFINRVVRKLEHLLLDVQVIFRVRVGQLLLLLVFIESFKS